MLASERAPINGYDIQPAPYDAFNSRLKANPEEVHDTIIKMADGAPTDTAVANTVSDVLDMPTGLELGPDAESLWAAAWDDPMHSAAQSEYATFVNQHLGELNSLRAALEALYNQICACTGDRQPLINEYEKLRSHPLLVEDAELRRKRTLCTLAVVARLNIIGE